MNASGEHEDKVWEASVTFRGTGGVGNIDGWGIFAPIWEGLAADQVGVGVPAQVWESMMVCSTR